MSSQRIGPLARAIPDSDVVTGCKQPPRHWRAHIA
jgi:hypothetical protein